MFQYGSLLDPGLGSFLSLGSCFSISSFVGGGETGAIVFAIWVG